MFELYEIPNQYKKLMTRILSCQTKEQFATEVNDSEFNFDEKNIFIAKCIKNLEAESEAVKKARDDMSERLKLINSNIETLNDFILHDINRTGLIDPIRCPEFVIKTQYNPPSLVIDNTEIIPDIYKVVKEVVTFDKVSIKKDIESGFGVDGARIERKKRLIIK